MTEVERTAPRVFVVSPGKLGARLPTGRAGPVSWRFIDATTFGRDGSHVERDGQPDLWVGLNVPPPRGATGRLGTVEISTELGVAAAGGRNGREPVISSSARWTPADRSDPVILDQVVAPVYPSDTWRDVRARGEELGLHLMRGAVGRVLCDGFQVQLDVAATGRSHGSPVRAFSAYDRLRWRLSRLVRRGARRLRPRSLVKHALLGGALLVVRPIRDRVRSWRRSHPIRIFTFHRVTDLCRDSLTASRRTFRAQLAYIRDTHRVVELDEALRLLADGAELDRPVAVITFDDAYRSVHDFAAPVLAELALSGCCFAPTGYVGTSDRFPWDRENPVVSLLEVMDWEELRNLRGRGWTIGGHTRTHRRLSECDESTLRRELQEPLEALRQRLDVEEVPMAYPFGGPNDIDEAGLRLAEALGYTACLSNHGGENFPSASPYRLRRIDIGGDHDRSTWKGRVHGIEPNHWLPTAMR